MSQQPRATKQMEEWQQQISEAKNFMNNLNARDRAELLAGVEQAKEQARRILTANDGELLTH